MYKPETETPNFDDDDTDDENPDGEEAATSDGAFTGIPMGDDDNPGTNGANGWGAEDTNGDSGWGNGNSVPVASDWG